MGNGSSRKPNIGDIQSNHGIRVSVTRNLHEVIFFCRGKNCVKDTYIRLAYTLDSDQCPSDTDYTWKYKVLVQKSKTHKWNTWPDAGMGLKVSCVPGNDNPYVYVRKLLRIYPSY